MSGSTITRPQSGDAQTTTRTSPPARRHTHNAGWRQPRFLVGCALIVGSVLVGALVVGGADDRVMVWSARHDLATGSVINADDLMAVPVAMDQAQRYLDSTGSQILGRRLARAVGQDELIAITAVGSGAADRRLITVPVEPVHAPTDLARGDRVDVYASPRDAATAGGASRLVLTNALVEQVSTDVDSARGELAVVLDVQKDQAAAIVNAVRTGVLDLVRVPIDAS